MNASNVSKKIMQHVKLYMLGAAVASAMALPTTALGWDYSQVPLFWDTGVHPNVALMLDDSGSMTALTVNESYQRAVISNTLSSQNWYWCDGSYNYPNKRCVDKGNSIGSFSARVWTPPSITATNLSVNSAFVNSVASPGNCGSSSSGFARGGSSGNTLNGVICKGNHGLTNGSALKYTTAATAPTLSGLTVGVTYYVINATQHGFQLSSSLTGGAIVPTISAAFGSGSFTFSGFKSGSLPSYISGNDVALCNTSKAPGTVGHYIGVSGTAPFLSSNELPTADTVGVLVSRTNTTSTGTNDSCVRWQMANTQRGTAAPENRDGSATEYDVNGYAKHLLNTLTSASPASLNFTDAAQYPVTDADTVNFVPSLDNKVIPNRNRIESAREAGQQVVLDNHHRMQIGLFSFKPSSGSYTGEMNLAIPDGTNPDQEKEDLISTTEDMAEAAMPLSAADGAIGILEAENYTPLAKTQAIMNSYFKGASSPIQYRCQKNYTVVMTDGDPTEDSGTLDGNAQTGYDTDCKTSGLDIGGGSYESTEFGGKWKVQNVETFTVGFGLENNLLKRTPLVNKVNVTKSDIVGNVIKLTSHGLSTGDYVQVVSGAAGGLTNGNYYYAVKVDGDRFKLASASSAGDTSSSTTNNIQDAFDCAATGTTSSSGPCLPITGGSGTMVMSIGPGKALFAQTPQDLSKALGDIFNKIAALVASASAVSTNSKQLGADTLVYQARFNTEDWSGEVAAYAVDPLTGKVNTVAPPAWTTKSTLDTAAEHGTMLTWNTNTNTGAAFTSLASIGATQSAALNDDVNALNWLRGDNITTPAGFRSHSTNGLMGDIINADPVFVGALNFGYGTLPPSNLASCTISGTTSSGSGCTGAETYPGYLADRKSTATPMLFVGTNGGQMHVLNSSTGVEIMSYLPAGVYVDWKDTNNNGLNDDGTALKKLYSLTQDSYDHRFFVDGAGATSDVFINNSWKTYFVGSLGAGGRSVYAIDASSASFSASSIKWEFTNQNLGYTYGKPTIARFPNNKWYAVFANGTDSNQDRASVFVVNIEDATDFHELTATNSPADTPASPNGMMTASVSQDSSRTAEYIYAGDMKGNIWKFYVGGGAWPSGTKLFTATDPTGMQQSITGGIRIGKNPAAAGNLIYFGTGKYFENVDKSYTTASVPQVDTFYAVFDGGTTGMTRSNLQQQTFATSGGLRTMPSPQPVTYPAKKGWFVDLLENTTKKGERMVSTPVLSGSRIIFVTIVPSGGDKCISNGTSWLNELDALNGNQLDDKVLDTNGDGKIDSLDTKVSGVQLDGMASEPSILQSGDGKDEKKIMGSTSATSSIITVTEKSAKTAAVGGSGRMSWQQIQ